jgi:predicted RNase H-like HicB family nuclease
MKGERTAVIEPAPEGGFWAICLEIPGANGQGESMEEARQNPQAAIEFLLEDREADINRGLPPDAVPRPLQIGSHNPRCKLSIPSTLNAQKPAC